MNMENDNDLICKLLLGWVLIIYLGLCVCGIVEVLIPLLYK